MKKLHLFIVMMLSAFALQAVAADTPLLQFDLNHFDGWTYHRHDVVLDHDLIAYNKVTLFTAASGEQYTLESPEFSCQGIDTLKVQMKYILDPGFNPNKVAPRVQVLDKQGNVLRSVDIPVLAEVITQTLESMIPVTGLTDATLLFSAPNAREVEEVFPVVKAVIVLGATTSGSEHKPGDVTGDGVVDVSDVNVVINVMLGKNQDPEVVVWCDINGDGMVDVSDVNLVINLMLGKG